VLSSQPGPPGIGLYPLLNTSIDNELAMLTPSSLSGRCEERLPFRLVLCHAWSSSSVPGRAG
jgi:hypothetical protein